MRLGRLKRKTVFQLLALLAVFVLAFSLASVAKEEESLRLIVADYGYWGVFFLSLVSGFNLIVPIPAIAFMPLFLVSGLKFFSTILVITLGMVIADSVAYALGKLGHRVASQTVSKESGWLKKLEEWKMRYRQSPLVIVFLYASFVPLPNELILIPLGLLGYKFLPILFFLAGGNLVFNILYSSGLLKIFELI